MTQLSLTSPVNGSEPSRPLIAKKQPNAIFVPTPHDVVAKMLKLADVKPTDTVFDLGSGDGRIVIAAAKTYRAKAIGLELDQELGASSREKIIAAGLEAFVQIEQRESIYARVEQCRCHHTLSTDQFNGSTFAATGTSQTRHAALSRTFSSLPIFRPKHRSGSSRQMTVTRTKSISGPRRFTKENDGR